MHTKKQDEELTAAISEATSDRYNSTVLVGNWYENRFSDKTDRRAITPCIYGESTCALGRSSYADNYAAPVAKHSPQDILAFMECRNLAFENRMKGYESNIKLYDNEIFMRNMTTMKDIMYRLKPQDARNYGEFDILKPQPKEDLLRSYGNATETGLNDWLKCEAMREARRRLDVSTYKEIFTPKPIQPRTKC